MRGELGGLPGGDGGEGGVGAEGADDESSNNLAAVRQYGFTEIVDLQDTMLRLQKAIGESNVEVEALKRQVSSAMQQRNVLLGLQSKAQLDDAAAAKEAQAEEARRAAAERKAKLSSSSTTKKKKKMGMKGSSSSSSRSSGGGGGGGGGVGAKKRRKKRGSPSGKGGALAMYRPAGKAGDVVGGLVAVSTMVLDLGKAIVETAAGDGPAGVEATNEAFLAAKEAAEFFGRALDLLPAEEAEAAE